MSRRTWGRRRGQGAGGRTSTVSIPESEVSSPSIVTHCLTGVVLKEVVVGKELSPTMLPFVVLKVTVVLPGGGPCTNALLLSKKSPEMSKQMVPGEKGAGETGVMPMMSLVAYRYAISNTSFTSLVH